jgi:uncharacterized protein (TIGR03435 family)
MQELDDIALLKQFAENGSEPAFAEIVSRHVNLVYSAALRKVGDAHAAQEISQAVFIILARKAQSLGAKTILSGWLHQTTRLTAANFLRGEIRRQKREQEAFMRSTLNEDINETWRQIAPVLDDAISKLGAKDRDAIVLRYFENKSLVEVGAAMGTGEDAAKMRVSRALEKLRKIFSKRGVRLSAALIAGAVSASSVQAAPVGLAKTISAVAMAKGAAATTSTLTLVKGALKIMVWTKMKTAIVVGVGVLLAAGTTTVVVKEFRPSTDADKYLSTMDWQAFQKAPPLFVVRPTHYLDTLGINATTDGKRMLGRDADMEFLIQYAHGFFVRTRIILPAEKLPTNCFDFVISVPRAAEKFQEEIKRRFGYVAHREIRNIDALALKVRNPNASGLKVSNGKESSQRDNLNWSGFSMEFLASQIENYLSVPVVDQTGLKGNYDVRLDWQTDYSTAGKEKFRQAVLDQLGLELVATNLPIEMLIVEKVK